MPSNPKLYLPNRVYFLTSRIEQGLPLVGAEHIKIIFEGILARATKKYNVIICHHLWMGNHFHMLVLVQDPEAISRFLCFVKTETSHAVNRLLGRRRRTVWNGGSDSPVLLTAEDVLDKIGYIYANPAEANLVDSIDDYPMISSWEMYKKRQYTKHCPVITRNEIPSLGAKHLSLRHQKAFGASLRKASKYKAVLRIEPYAWLKCFPELQNLPRKEIDHLIISRVRQKEEAARKTRKGSVLGALALQTQDMDILHEPKKFSRKMICICSEKAPRLDFIQWAKSLFYLAKQVYAAWKKGDYSLTYPPGLFPPRRPRLANLLPPL